jgi:N-acetyl sugar amidotransferase
MPNTRPRITFDESGKCNACLWAEEKKKINWNERWAKLESLCQRFKKRNQGRFDCIVPVSGGKDSSYVAFMMKEKCGMNPLCITIRPPLEDEVGKQNLSNFIHCGFNHITITPDPMISRIIDKESLIAHGRPMQAWMISVQTAIFRCAVQFDIPFVMWGEDGEMEYGGVSKLKNEVSYALEDSINIYLSGVDPNQFLSNKISQEKLYWWSYPSAEAIQTVSPVMAHWSYFENWDPYEHYLLAKEKCGLQERSERCNSTYNNFGQTDTNLYDLYIYFMYLKFGFGRTTQDVGIDIRRGAMTREQGLALVKLYDGEYPEAYIESYLDYFQMPRSDFELTFDEHVNKQLFRKEKGRWLPEFEPY